MELYIQGNSKEIADFLLTIGNQQNVKVEIDKTINQIASGISETCDTLATSLNKQETPPQTCCS